LDQSSKLDEIFNESETLSPDDRLRLIARVWASMPVGHWAAPSARDLFEVRGMLGDIDTDRLGEVPWKIVRQMSDIRPATPTTKIYSAPRSFDLATIFVVTFAYSLLFAVMSLASFPPMMSLAVGAFITVVGVCQAVLFGGRYPRAASYLSGAVLYVAATIIMSMLAPRGFRIEYLVLGVPLSILFGAIFGYLAGVLVGGVFLVADLIRNWFAHGATTPDDVDAVASADADQ
jgi:hypothetical protein